MGEYKFKYKREFILESGSVLPELEICYTALGKLNNKRDNVIWIIHALTGNSNPLQWWEGLVGKNKLYDPDKYFIVCTNNLGSCYGTTGPLSINPLTKKRYGKDFPDVTIRDMVKANILLRKHLRFKKIHIVTGGSLGGQICLEWAIKEPDVFNIVIPISANAKHSAWGIAFNETQRMAIDNTRNGIKTARAIALLSYRCYRAYEKTQTDNDFRIDGFSASSYQQYQGAKFETRFDKQSYFILSKAMDSHNVGRNRGNIGNALNTIKAKVLVIGIKSDILFPVQEQKFITSNIKNAKLQLIDSLYGHDGFLIEFEKIERIINKFI